jgi:hypothetical protein
MTSIFTPVFIFPLLSSLLLPHAPDRDFILIVIQNPNAEGAM